jgi:hypothetical protein
MKTRLCALLFTCGVGLYAQAPQAGNPFIDHSDTGETVHVLPTPASIRSPRDTQPTVAPPHKGTAVYPASYGSGNLTDHGGLEIPNAGFQAIYWNSSAATSTSTSLGYTSLQSQIGAFVSMFADNANWDSSSTDDYTVVQQYGSKTPIANSLASNPANNLSLGSALVDSQGTVSRYRDSQVQSYLTSLFNSGKLAAKNNVIYGMYFPTGMTICLQGGCSCSSFCGYHSHFSYGSTQIKYAVFPSPNCTGCSISGLSAADMLTIVSSHEIREAVTDPGDFNTNAWYDSSGYEADDKCAWHNLYQMTNGGFWVQPEYSNGGARTASGFTATYPGSGCVVPNR